jgi:hypothetical protein
MKRLASSAAEEYLPCQASMNPIDMLLDDFKSSIRDQILN